MKLICHVHTLHTVSYCSTSLYMHKLSINVSISARNSAVTT